MPTRLLSETYVSSDHVARLPPGTQLRFPRYLLAADDWGCFSAQPVVLWSRLFPHLLEHVSVADVTGDLDAMAKVGILGTWHDEDGRAWAHFHHWFRHQRRPRDGAKPKTPPPPWGYEPGKEPIPRPTTREAREAQADEERRAKERDRKRRQRTSAADGVPHDVPDVPRDMSHSVPRDIAGTDRSQPVDEPVAQPCRSGGAPAGAGAGAGAGEDQDASRPPAAPTSSPAGARRNGAAAPLLQLEPTTSAPPEPLQLLAVPPTTPAGKLLAERYAVLEKPDPDGYTRALSELYPMADVADGIRRSAAWLEVNRAKQPKGKRGTELFLKGWLRRDHNAAARKGPPDGQRPPPRVLE
jgi:hypothetical protein